MLFRIIRPALFALDSEAGHRLAIRGLAALPRRAPMPVPRALGTTVAGLTFPNPVGVAAGFDKDAEAGGLMQRFLFATVGDPHASMDAPFMPEPPPLVYKISDNIPFDRRFGSDTFEPHPDKGWVFTYDPGVVIEVLRTLRAIRQEPEDSRHGHRNFLKLRVAALLAIMHGGDSVTRHWFDQAEHVMAHSDATLNALIAVQRQSKRAEDTAKGIGDAERALAGETAILHKTADRVVEILRRDGTLATSRIKQRLTKSMHDNMDAALALLEEQGRVVRTDITKNEKQPRKAYEWRVV